MDPVISDLIDRYEGGRLSRRDLVAGLSALAAAGAAAPALAQAAAPPMKVTGIDHVSMLVTDLKRSTDFYTGVFGLSLAGADTANKIQRLGPKPVPGQRPRVMVSLRQQPPAGTVDHWCFRTEGFTEAGAAETLKAHGLTPDKNVEFGFYVRDPDGVVVQMI
jgi:catechol 2,3-dioxygenase-like lactoylglutathione lyase family enzyme